MKKSWRKILTAGCVAALLMALSGIPVLAADVQEQIELAESPQQAAASGIKASGTCGENAKWELSEDGKLTISGQGVMKFESGNVTWNEYKEEIRAVSIAPGITNVADRAFSECHFLTTMSLPDTITEIGENAFFGCIQLLDAYLPESVTDIKPNAFNYCIALRSVDLPEKLTSIGQGAFYRCSSLESVVIPGAVQEIGISAFDSCTSLTKAVISNGVKELRAGAFFNCTKLKDVVLPESIIYIEESVFKGCEDLKTAGPLNSNANIKYGWTTELPKYAFGGCDGLVEIELPSAVTSIPKRSFINCESLKKISIPESVTSIGEEAFKSCTSLEQVTLPNTAIEFGADVFNDCTSLESITIPEKVTRLGVRMFKGCSGLTKVSLPIGVSEICANAFADCERLTDVYYGGIKKQWETITIASGNDSLLNANIIFQPGKDIRNCEIILSETACDYDGSEKKPAVTVKFQGSILREDTDFTVTYKNNINGGTATVTVDGRGDYTGSTQVDFKINPIEQTVSAEPWTNEIGIQTTTPIRTAGFGGITFRSSNPSVASVELWGSNASVNGHKAGTATITVSFSGNSNYLPAETSFTINVLDVYMVDSGTCGSQAAWTYYNNGTVRVTGTGAMAAVRQPNGDYNWNEYYNPNKGFGLFEKVNTVIVEDGITAIEPYTFAIQGKASEGRMSDSPRTVELSDTVQSIGRYAFYYCDKLEKVSIGSGLSTIGGYAFSYCSGLKEFSVSDNNQCFKSVDGILYDKKMTKILKVPTNCGIMDFTVPDNVTTISNDAIGDVKTLTTIRIPRSVTAIESYAFDGCANLTDVYYAGSKSEWQAISIGDSNSPLSNATIHYAIEDVELSNCSITISPTDYTYDGTAKYPAVTMTYKNASLEKDRDYSVAYTDNINAGTAKVTISGKGIYTGERTLTFTIKKASAQLKFRNSSVTKTNLDKGFTNTLSKSTDADVTYKSSNTKVAKINSKSGVVSILGTGTVTITAMVPETDNYNSGKASYTLTVKEGRTDIAGLAITLEQTEYTYDGNQKNPLVFIENNGIALEKDADYSAVYSDNLNAGTASVHITGKGSYMGESTLSFSIKKASAQLKFQKKSITKTNLDKAFTNTLTKSTDAAVKYKSSDVKVAEVDSGSGLVTIRGTGSATITASAPEGSNYNSGKASYKVTVTEGRTDLSGCVITLDKTHYYYDGKAKKPGVTVKDGSQTLQLGTDYTISYGKNIVQPEGTVTITGKGRYMGTVTKRFTIEDASIRSISLEETDITMIYGTERPLPAVTYTPAYTTDEKTVLWSSSDESVAYAEAEQLKALNPGNAVLTARVPNRKVQASVNIRVLFKDVAKESDWYYDSVYWAVENNITSGMGEGTFRPMAKLSRAQAVTFLYNLAGKPDVSKLQAKEFTDVSKNAWYYNAVKWAVANKITSGYGTGTFQPNATCNRAMIVTFLANYAKAAGTYKEPTTSASFKDVKATDWFRKSVDWAVENGITSGYGQGTFSPNVTCNRAMMVTFLKKVAELRKV